MSEKLRTIKSSVHGDKKLKSDFLGGAILEDHILPHPQPTPTTPRGPARDAGLQHLQGGLRCPNVALAVLAAEQLLPPKGPEGEAFQALLLDVKRQCVAPTPRAAAPPPGAGACCRGLCGAGVSFEGVAAHVCGMCWVCHVSVLCIVVCVLCECVVCMDTPPPFSTFSPAPWPSEWCHFAGGGVFLSCWPSNTFTPPPSLPLGYYAIH